MKRSVSKRNKWEDHYSRKAKKERFPARSVYKLKEIQKKHRLIKKGDRVLDLGCAPGSWLLYAAQFTGESGEVVGVDLKDVPVKVPDHARVLQGDILSADSELLKKFGKRFNVVLSDMAPSTTGNKHVDNARSYNLCQAALSIAQDVLLPGGAFVCKIFQGEDFNEFSNSTKKLFRNCSIFKPLSSKKASREIYIIGLGKI
jgi:23S rRNA (uridine2552-2'-O)-methyltransferase